MRVMSCFFLHFGVALFGVVAGGSVSAQTSWVQRFPVNAPGGRALHVVTSVYGEGRVLMHGGRRPGSSAIYSDLWQWSGGGWTQLPTNNVLLPRWGHAMAYDVVRQRLVCFGGNAGSATQPNAETWLWDGQSWFQASASGPVARSEHAMVYDSVRQRCVMFGGVSTTSLLGDTWDWDGSA